jgi:uncharacterized YigZ family protein
MTERRFIPAEETRTEIRVSNSRFIATGAPVFSVDEAKMFLARLRAEFPDATHNVPAYLIGHGRTTIAHCHDDGEPSGTAGRPILAVLQGSGLGDIAIVVTRYFGGTKLGTGGLVRAYSDAAKAVLAVTPLAEKVATSTVMVAIPYALYERLLLLIEACNGSILDESFAAEITLTVRLSQEIFRQFEKALEELSHGQIEAMVVELSESTIMPVSPDPRASDSSSAP